jgi:hypothetical protein
MGRRLISMGVILCVVFLLSSCAWATIHGSGHIVSQDRAASGFSQVDLQGSGDVILTQGTSEGVRIETDDNLVDYVTTEVVGDTLYLSVKNPQGEMIWPSHSITYYVEFKSLKGITLDGSGDISTKSIDTDGLVLQINGSGDIQVDALAARSVVSTIRGSGDCSITGKANTQAVEIIGSGDYVAPDLESQTASVSITGSGNAVVRASISLDVRITGSGDVNYYGNPRVSKQITGSGDVHARKME